jgi:hypothetical protein
MAQAGSETPMATRRAAKTHETIASKCRKDTLNLLKSTQVRLGPTEEFAIFPSRDNTVADCARQEFAEMGMEAGYRGGLGLTERRILWCHPERSEGSAFFVHP